MKHLKTWQFGKSKSDKGHFWTGNSKKDNSDKVTCDKWQVWKFPSLKQYNPEKDISEKEQFQKVKIWKILKREHLEKDNFEQDEPEKGNSEK